MIIRYRPFGAFPEHVLGWVRSSTTTPPPRRRLHVPPPTPFVPDVPTFLKVIGRNSIQHASKFPNWDALFTLSSLQLRGLGLEPARARRYLLRWRDKFRKGDFGVGGDLTEVVDGVAELRIVEVPVSAHRSGGTVTLTPGTRKIIVNVKPGSTESALPATTPPRPVNGMGIRNGHVIAGPYVRAVEGSHGSVARMTAVEGMWEHRRGHKVDGGERRKAEVRAKRRSQDRA